MTQPVCFRILRSSLVGLVLLVGLHGAARAQGGCLSGGTGGCPPDSGTPEIDPSLATGGLALLGGVVLVVRSRRRG